MTTVIKNAKLYSMSMTSNPISIPNGGGWVDLGYTTTGTGDWSFSTTPARKKPRPYQYLIATDEKTGERFKVQWRKRSPNHEVWVGLTLIGETFQHSEGWWSCVDRFGTIVRGFQSRKQASVHLLENHFQFTPSLETQDDYNKQL